MNSLVIDTPYCRHIFSNLAGFAITNPYVILREEFDDWVVLFDPDTGNGFGLSPTGVYVWKLLDGEHTVEEMVGDLRRYQGSTLIEPPVSLCRP